MKNLILSIIIFVPSCIFSQSTLEFQSKNPKWQHSSEFAENSAGIYIGITPLITKTNLFLPTLLGDKGYLLEKIDMISGEVKWENYYFPIGLIDREFPQKPFINNNNRLVLPSFREYDTYDDDFFWDEARLAYRIFDLDSGAVLDSVFSDSSGQKIYNPWSSISKGSILINNKNSIQYFQGSGAFLYSYIFDSNADVLVDTLLNPLNPVFHSGSEKYVLSDDNIIIFSPLGEFFTGEKRMRVNVYNLDFEFQKSIDITKYLFPEYYQHTITYADESFFIIESTLKDIVNDTSIISNKNYYMFNYDGVLIDKFFLEWEGERNGNKYYYNIYAKPNKDGNKMLVLLVNDNEEGYHTLYIKESDGNDELVTLGEFVAKNTKIKFDIFHFNLTQSGDLLVTFQYIEEIEPGTEWARFFKSITMLISKDDF